jgi:hypothetical protein
MDASLMVESGMRIFWGTVAAKKDSMESKPSFDSINSVSLSSGPTCLSAKVSSDSKRVAGVFAVASPRLVMTLEREMVRTTDCLRRVEAMRRAMAGQMVAERKRRVSTEKVRETILVHRARTFTE